MVQDQGSHDGVLNGRANELQVRGQEAIWNLVDRYDTFLFDVTRFPFFT